MSLKAEKKIMAPKPPDFLLVELVPTHSIMQGTYPVLILRPMTIRSNAKVGCDGIYHISVALRLLPDG
jgi:hypothetical protein